MLNGFHFDFHIYSDYLGASRTSGASNERCNKQTIVQDVKE